MSGKISGMVWDLALEKSEKLVLLAMTDHADHLGRNMFPGVGLVAWKTDLSVRTVERAMASLERRGVLVLQEDRPGSTKIYRADLSKAPQKPPYRGRRAGRGSGEPDETGCVTVTHPPEKPNDAPGASNRAADAAEMTHPFHEPSRTVMEPSSTRAHESASDARPKDDDDDDPRVDQVLEDFRTRFRRTSNAKDRSKVRAWLAVYPLEVILRGVRLSAERTDEPVSSIAYCSGAIEEEAKRLARSNVGAAPDVAEERPPAPVVTLPPPPRPKPATRGALALDVRPLTGEATAALEVSAATKKRVYDDIGPFVGRFASLNGRAATLDDIRAHVLEFCLEHSIDPGVVDVMYPASKPKPPASKPAPPAPRLVPDPVPEPPAPDPAPVPTADTLGDVAAALDEPADVVGAEPLDLAARKRELLRQIGELKRRATTRKEPEPDEKAQAP